MTTNFNYLFKFIIVGDSSVGKSNLLLRYLNDKFEDEYQATIGVEFGAKNISIDNIVYRIQLWDTAGQEQFRSITRAYYQNSVCAIVVYDITNELSFKNIQVWIDDVKAQSPKSIFIMLVGNKTDLENKREISYEKGLKFAESNNISFIETSAKNGSNVENLFINCTKIIANKLKNNEYDLSDDSCGIKVGIILNNRTEDDNKKKRKCC
jgi:Ras-related protein Rab-2A